MPLNNVNPGQLGRFGGLYGTGFGVQGGGGNGGIPVAQPGLPSVGGGGGANPTASGSPTGAVMSSYQGGRGSDFFGTGMTTAGMPPLQMTAPQPTPQQPSRGYPVAPTAQGLPNLGYLWSSGPTTLNQ